MLLTFDDKSLNFRWHLNDFFNFFWINIDFILSFTLSSFQYLPTSDSFRGSCPSYFLGWMDKVLSSCLFEGTQGLPTAIVLAHLISYLKRTNIQNRCQLFKITLVLF